MMYELAFQVKDPKSIRRIRSLLEELYYKKEAVQGRVIAENLCNIYLAGKSSSILYTLKDEKILITEKPSQYIQDYIFKLNYQSFNSYFEREEFAADVITNYYKIMYKEKKDKFTLVSTIPDAIADPLKKTNQIETALIRLISRARINIWIVNPFFDEFGASRIIDSLVGAAKEGVKINILGRDFNVDTNPGMVKAAAFIASVFEEEGFIDFLEFRDLFFRSEDGRQKYALHTKMLISESSAYIGSANLTEHSLRNNFELGVIIEGEHILTLIELINEIWKCSSKVEVSALMY